MKKNKGILIDPATNEIDVQVIRNTEGKITQGFRVGDVTYQNIASIIVAQPGEYKEHPMIGVGVDDMLLNTNKLLYKHRIREQLELEGLILEHFTIDEKINITAKYK